MFAGNKGNRLHGFYDANLDAANVNYMNNSGTAGVIFSESNSNLIMKRHSFVNNDVDCIFCLYNYGGPVKFTVNDCCLIGNKGEVTKIAEGCVYDDSAIGNDTFINEFDEYIKCDFHVTKIRYICTNDYNMYKIDLIKPYIFVFLFL